MTSKTPFVVTGPGAEGHPVESVGHGLSAASTFACRTKEVVTFYVRDRKGEIHGYAAREEGNIVIIRRVK